MHASEYDYLFKLLLIGDSGVGKVIKVFPLGIALTTRSRVAFSSVSPTTLTPKATFPLLESTSRSGQLN